ncbi:MAG: hypothetical protein VXZ96_20565 [Myxococcota bacterium]|nr:hypothetical protein [Myxococcota bacterium]
MISLLLTLAYGAPKTPFAAPHPPQKYADLERKKTVYRLWWESNEPAELQYLRKGRWSQLAENVTSGYTTKPLPLGVQFRIRSSGESKWSDPFQAAPYWTPSDISALGERTPIRSQTIGELVLGSDSLLWGSTLGGGLLRIHTGQKKVTQLGHFEGLPSQTVISIDAEDNRVLLGTSEGAVLLVNGIPKRYWKAELPHPYTQSVRIIGDSYWLGTYEGLYIDSPQGSSVPLRPFSIFSIEPLSQSEVAVGYQGLQKIIDEEDAFTWLDSTTFHAYDMLNTGSELYIATPEKGVQRLDNDKWTLIQNEDATQLALGVHGLWMAAGTQGLVHSSGERLGVKDGLAGQTVWSVAAQGQSIWAGTNGGLNQITLDESGQVSKTWTQKISRTPIERTATAVLSEPNGTFFAGDSGVWSFGQAHRYANNLSVAAPSPTIAIVRKDKSIWAFGSQTAVIMNRKGELSRVNYSFIPEAVTVWNGYFWLATTQGVFRLSPDSNEFILAYPKVKVNAFAVYNDMLWGIGSGGELVQFSPNQIRPFIQTGYALSISPSGEALCVGTENGLERYWHRKTAKVEDVLGDGDLGIAIDAVAGDGSEGCWFGGEEGTIGWVGPNGAATKINLPGLKPPDITKIVPTDERTAWILTSKGTWRVRLNQ